MIDKYERQLNTINTNVFREEYYTGTDVKITLDDVPLELESIQYTIQEQQKPIYGYASRTYDAVSVGSRIVFGTLRVPVKNLLDNNTKLTQISLKDTDDYTSKNHKVASTSYTNPNNSSIESIKDVSGKSFPHYSNIKDRNQKVIDTPESNVADNITIPAWVRYTKSGDINSTLREQTSITKYINKESDVIISNTTINNSDRSYVYEYTLPMTYDEKFKDIQKSLIKLGYNVDVNGYYDLKTFIAIKVLQNKKHLEVTGNIDKSTYSLLLTSDYPKSGFINNFYGDSLKTGPFDNSALCSDNIPYKNIVSILGSIDNYYKIQLSNSKVGYIKKESVAVG